MAPGLNFSAVACAREAKLTVGSIRSTRMMFCDSSNALHSLGTRPRACLCGKKLNAEPAKTATIKD